MPPDSQTPRTGSSGQVVDLAEAVRARREARPVGCCWACHWPIEGEGIRTRGTTVCSEGCKDATEEAIAP